MRIQPINLAVSSLITVKGDMILVYKRFIPTNLRLLNTSNLCVFHSDLNNMKSSKPSRIIIFIFYIFLKSRFLIFVLKIS